ncbi:BspA family leucine-rich repeat surface protein [Bifidobacterium sp. ESL0790]|uniref:BspA family leucine-rich repeat surface protein n=1 Tax=Bifidobacterium sp. ESL0790 TaxID=2983233 RepID=UPI0023F8D8E7|nr:BspA family leucine-rich repeat surface protein [Bifidobacterium sp. ESL0790]WEV72519.1 BspA family leucine-rich repeat surface protein [Bifidobacterium sp. ESL0790]
MTAGKKMPKILGSVAALAMLCGAVTVSATASDANKDTEASQTSSSQQVDLQKQDNNKDGKEGSDPAVKDEASQKTQPEQGTKSAASTPKPQAQGDEAPAPAPGSSPMLGKRPTVTSVKMTYGANGAFKMNIIDGSYLDFHSDGSYLYHSFDGTETTASPTYSDPASNGYGASYNFAFDAPVQYVVFNPDGSVKVVKFTSDKGLIEEFNGDRMGQFKLSRNDSWKEEIHPMTWGTSTIIQNAVSAPRTGNETYYLYDVGPGTIGSFETSSWKRLLNYYNTSVPDGTRLRFTDPEHTKLPADSSRMFSGISTPGFLDMDQIGRLDTSQVTNMSNLFYKSPSVTGTSVLKNWDTSKVTDMTNMFRNTRVSEISALSHWNLDKVQNMSWMFYDAHVQTLDGAENISFPALTNMSCMFALDPDIKDVSVMGTWDTSHVTTMNRLFQGSQGYADQSPATDSLTELKGVDRIHMDSVTDASKMFAYNQNLTSIGGIRDLQVSNVNDVSSMFVDDWALTNLDLSGWDTRSLKNVTTMLFMSDSRLHDGDYAPGRSKLASVDVSGWNTSALDDIGSLFSGCVNLTEIKGISAWDTSSITGMSGVFCNCWKLDSLDLSRWNVSNAITVREMFENVGKDASNVDLSSLASWRFGNDDVEVFGMFQGCAAKTLPVDDWDMGNITNINYMFAEMPNITTIDLSKWDTHSVNWVQSTFRDSPKLESVDLGNWNTKGLCAINDMFNGDTSLVSVGDLSHKKGSDVWDTSKVQDMECAFKDCPSLKSLDLSGWDLSTIVTSSSTGTVCVGGNCTVHVAAGVDEMFSGDSGLETLNMADWNMPQVTTLDNMFKGATGLKNLDLSNWDASKITSFDNTFTDVGSPDGMKLNLSNWKVNKDVNIEMSLRDTNVAELDLSGWDTTTDTGFRPRFSSKLRLLTVGPKTQLRPEYFAPGSEPGGLLRDTGSYTGQWVEASAKADAKQTCTVDGTTYTAKGESWTSCGRATGTSATVAMMAHANANGKEATYVWEQSAKVHFAGLDALRPKAPYNDSVMAPQSAYGVDALGIKVDGSEKTVDVRGLIVGLPAELRSNGFTNVGWLRDGDATSNISAPGTQMSVPAGEQVVRAMWTRDQPITINVPTHPVPPSQPSQPGGGSGPQIPNGSQSPFGRTRYLFGSGTAAGPFGAANNGQDSLANKNTKSKKHETTKKPLCLPGYVLSSAYVVDEAGYVVPTATRCVPSDASANASVATSSHAAFPWWIVLLAAVALIGYYCYANRDRFVYAQHRDDSYGRH